MSGVAALPQSGIRLSVTLSSGDRRTGPGWAGHTPVSPLACSHRGSLLRHVVFHVLTGLEIRLLLCLQEGACILR